MNPPRTQVAERGFVHHVRTERVDLAHTGHLVAQIGGDRAILGEVAWHEDRRLSEQEVAQLYARRQQEEVNLLARLDEVVRFASAF